MDLKDTYPKILIETATTQKLSDLPATPIWPQSPPTPETNTIATTIHLSDEQMPAELALVPPTPQSRGVLLAVKLRMSPRDHTPPKTLRLPVVVLPEGASVFDVKNATLQTVDVDLSMLWEAR